MFTIYCHKNSQSQLWCFDHLFTEDLEVVEEPLMHQATALIDSILMEQYQRIPENISVIFSDNELFEPDAILKYQEPSGGGSVYRSTQVLKRTENYEHNVWLCPVLTYFYKTPPKKLYVLITEDLKNSED